MQIDAPKAKSDSRVVLVAYEFIGPNCLVQGKNQNNFFCLECTR